MKDDKLYEALDDGAILEVKLAGVTFPSVNTSMSRQEVIEKISPHAPIILVPEPNNEYDPFAIRVDVVLNNTQVDIGYLPKKGSASIETGTGRAKQIVRDNLNAVLGNYPGKLTGRIKTKIGGYNRKSYGVLVELYKEVTRKAKVRHG